MTLAKHATYSFKTQFTGLQNVYSIFIALAPLVLILPPIMKKVDIVEY